jgi:Tol biopolymer transport system component
VSWDGAQLAVRSGVGGPKISLVVGPVDTAVRRVILEGADITSLSWLGNGTIVACFTPVGGSPRLVKIPSGGGAALTVREGCPSPASGSPDGNRIAFTTPTSLDVIESSGKVITLPRAGLLAQPPSWSPGSDRLAYGYTDDQGRALGVFDIGNALANQVARAEADQPAFSPKGDRILFTGRTTAGGPRQILSVGPAGGAVKVIASCSGRCLLPRSAWSPDGSAVVVDSSAGS